MKRKIHLTFAAAAVMLLAACSEDVVLTPDQAREQSPESNAISFGTYLGGTGSTRAGATGAIVGPTADSGHTLGSTGYEFGVFAYLTTNAWANDSANATANFMYNQKVEFDSSTKVWKYSPVKYWPNGEDGNNTANNPSNSAKQDYTNAKKLSFFAYAPYVDLSASSIDWSKGITAINGANTLTGSAPDGTGKGSGNQKTGDPMISYKLAQGENFVDLLWGTRGTSKYTLSAGTDSEHEVGATYNTDLTKQTTTETVDFLFKHALAKIGGAKGLKVMLDVDDNAGGALKDEFTCVTISNLTIQNAANGNVSTGGTLDLSTGEWTPNNADASQAEGSVFKVELKQSSDFNTEIYKEGTGENIATYDQPSEGQTSGTWSPLGVTNVPKQVYAENSTASPIYLMPDVEDQKLKVSITYLVQTYDTNLKGNYSKVSQTITNEVTLPKLDKNTAYTLIIHIGLTSVKFSASVADWEQDSSGSTAGEIWLPSNVVEDETESVTVQAGTSAYVLAKADQTSYTINLTGLTNGNTLTATVDPTTNSISGTPTIDTDGKAAVTVTLAKNEDTSSTKKTTVTITEKDSDSKVVSTTTVVITQSKAASGS